MTNEPLYVIVFLDFDQDILDMQFFDREERFVVAQLLAIEETKKTYPEERDWFSFECWENPR